MNLYGLIGFPLGHSFSVRFFTEKFEREGIAARYLNFEIPTIGQLPEIIREHPDLHGLNVTIPYKQAVLPLLDTLSEEAGKIGAVNVIRIRHEGGIVLTEGHNTDVIGFSQSICPLLGPGHKRALILGTGGASRAVDFGLRRLGITPTFVSRTHRNGEPYGTLTYNELTPEKMEENTVIVNCTPIGMHPHTDEAPALPYEEIGSSHLLYDLIYNPRETEFLRRGAQQGAITKNGLEMLHLQAIAAWEIWQG